MEGEVDGFCEGVEEGEVDGVCEGLTLYDSRVGIGQCKTPSFQRIANKRNLPDGVQEGAKDGEAEGVIEGV